MEDLVQSYYGIYGCDVIEENFYYLDQKRYRVVAENVSGGRNRRANFNRAPIPQRVSSAEADRLRSDAIMSRQQNEPQTPSAPRYKNPIISLPSRGIGPEEPLLRTASSKVTTKEGKPGKKRGISPKRLARYKANYLRTGTDNRPGSNRPRFVPTDKSKARARVINTALKNAKRWGTPEANAIAEHLINEGYVNDYNSALVILESMTNEWLIDIISEFLFETYLEENRPGQRERGYDRASLQRMTDRRLATSGSPFTNPTSKRKMDRTNITAANAQSYYWRNR